MAQAHVPMRIVEEDVQGSRAGTGPLIKYYMPTELVPDKKPVLYRLMEHQPASWAAVQIMSGILSFGLGVVFAAAFNISDMLLTLFRVPILTGILFFVSGCLSNLLYRHPGLLMICFISNACCLLMAMVGAVLLCVDLGKKSFHENLEHQVEILILCVTLLDMIICGLLLYFIYAEKRNLREK